MALGHNSVCTCGECEHERRNRPLGGGGAGLEFNDPDLPALLLAAQANTLPEFAEEQREVEPGPDDAGAGLIEPGTDVMTGPDDVNAIADALAYYETPADRLGSAYAQELSRYEQLRDQYAAAVARMRTEQERIANNACTTCGHPRK